jgi:hypothetical protein
LKSLLLVDFLLVDL